MGDAARSGSNPIAPITPTPEKIEASDEAYQAAADLDRNDARVLKFAPDLLEELRLLDAPGESGSQNISDPVLKSRDRLYRNTCDRLSRIMGRDVAFG